MSKAHQDINNKPRAISKKISIFVHLAPFFTPYKLLLVASILALVFTSVISLIVPLAVRQLIDNFESTQVDLLDKYFFSALIVAGLLAAGTALRYTLVTKIGERVITDIRIAVFDKVVGMSPVFYEKLLTGEVLSRITTDTTLVLSVIGSSISIALRNILIFFGGLIFMIITSLKLTGLVLLIVTFVLLPILTLGRRVRRLSKENQDWIAKGSANATQSLEAVQTVQAFTHEQNTKAIFSEIMEKGFVSAKRRIWARALMTMIVIFLVFSAIIGVLWIGAYDVRAENLSQGTLVQFVIYSVMVGGSVAAISEVWGELQRAAGATERLIDLLDSRDEILDPKDPVKMPKKIQGALTFENVSFRYPSRPDYLALEDFSLTISPGEKVALVGRSGAGKSTIIQLLLRFYDPDLGVIKLDGNNLRDMERKEFRRFISLVPQDPVIFANTVMENIRFGCPEAKDKEIIEAANTAAAHKFIIELPDGYHTYVGERGVMLSGGQKQRIALARAILRNAPLLLLDEATSSLDAESEQAVQLAVDWLAKNRTTLIVAHRLATVKKADRIIVLDKGKIIATGSHTKLVREDGLYAKLAKLQFADGTQ